jgi:hypothetical protein
VQQQLVEAGLVRLGDDQHLVVVAREPLRQLALGDAVVHRGLGEQGACGLRVDHRARERG